jgi:hypothetical protein
MMCFDGDCAVHLSDNKGHSGPFAGDALQWLAMAPGQSPALSVERLQIAGILPATAPQPEVPMTSALARFRRKSGGLRPGNHAWSAGTAGTAAALAINTHYRGNVNENTTFVSNYIARIKTVIQVIDPMLIPR